MLSTGYPMFLLEVIVNRVLLTNPDESSNMCPLCVCLKFPLIANIELCESDYCGDQKQGGADVKFTKGKSVIFSVAAQNLYKTAQHFGAFVSVYRQNTSDNIRIVAQNTAYFDKTFDHLIVNPNQSNKTRESTQKLCLYDNSKKKHVGTAFMCVRLTSLGALVTTQISKGNNDEHYQYKAVDQFVPADVPTTHFCKVKKINDCCHYKAHGTKNTNREHDCNKYTNRLQCLATAMDLVNKYFTAVIAQQEANKNGSFDRTPLNTGPCFFNAECSVMNCPFKTQEMGNALVNRLISSHDHRNLHNTKHGKTVRRSSKRLKSKDDYLRHTDPEMEPIAKGEDLFIVNIGRIDPCRFTLPDLRDMCTQYSEGDLPFDWLQPPVQTMPKIGKTNKKSKGGKRKKK